MIHQNGSVKLGDGSVANNNVQKAALNNGNGKLNIFVCFSNNTFFRSRIFFSSIPPKYRHEEECDRASGEHGVESPETSDDTLSRCAQRKSDSNSYDRVKSSILIKLCIWFCVFVIPTSDPNRKTIAIIRDETATLFSTRNIKIKNQNK